MKSPRAWLESVLGSGNAAARRPLLDKHNQSNVKGLYIVGDLAGAPVIKLAMAQAAEVVEYLARQSDLGSSSRRRRSPAWSIC